MDSLSSVSPSIVPPLRCNHHYHRRWPAVSFSCRKSIGGFGSPYDFRGRHHNRRIYSKLGGEADQEGGYQRRDEDLERALRMDVLEANPWQESSKSVYVLTHQENQLCTMKTRRNRSEVEKELGLLFCKGGKKQNKSKQPGTSTKFQMLVEDVREGVLVFEDQNEAARYCDLLQGGGQACEGVAEIEASSVFDLCQKNRALAVLFHRGRTPPLPESLKLDLGARKHSLEDEEDLA
ncbi:uncharacterized protein LOC121769372 isoform X2 [Salvia splendens]|uniref:uncharacterized protein LOC121769372 isoform X2 n=1 Tax=Salvia splendens TaxID=180675 RepID=UPI001C2685A7|nr:uncharacterized protein LOC121769372 isoform X2 [Salvia splendens]